MLDLPRKLPTANDMQCVQCGLTTGLIYYRGYYIGCRFCQMRAQDDYIATLGIDRYEQHMYIVTHHRCGICGETAVACNWKSRFLLCSVHLLDCPHWPMGEPTT